MIDAELVSSVAELPDPHVPAPPDGSAAASVNAVPVGAAAERIAVTDRVSLLSTSEVIARDVLESVTAEVTEPADGALSARFSSVPLTANSESSVAVNVVWSVALFAADTVPVTPERMTIAESSAERERNELEFNLLDILHLSLRLGATRLDITSYI